MRFILRKVTAALLKRHLAWKQDEKMTVSFNRFVPDKPAGSLTIGTGDQQFTFAQTSLVECLGGTIDIDGAPDPLLEGRIQAMRAHYWQRAKQLQNKRVPLTIRLHRYAHTVRRTGLYLAGSHTWTQRMARRFLAAEATMVRRMWGPKKGAAELWQDWQVRTIRGARLWIQRIGLPTILQEALSAGHRWGGHVARMDGTHFTRICNTWRNTGWWRKRQEHGQTWDAVNDTGWRHGRCGTAARWDGAITGFFGRAWLDKAQDRDWWAAHEAEFVTKRHGDLAPPKPGTALPPSDTPRPQPAPQWADW